MYNPKETRRRISSSNEGYQDLDEDNSDAIAESDIQQKTAVGRNEKRNSDENVIGGEQHIGYHTEIDISNPEEDQKTENHKDESDDNDTNKKKDSPMKIPKLSRSQIAWLMQLAKYEWWILILGLIGLLVSSGINLLIPQYIGSFIDAATQGKTTFSTIAMSLAAFTVVMSLFNALRAFCFNIAGERVVARLRKQLFSNLIIQEIGFFDQTKTGELINRLSSDTKALENAVTINVSMAARFVLQAIGAVFILFFLSWKLTLVMMSVVPPVVLGAVIYGRFVKNLSKKVQDGLAKSSDIADESFSNVRTVRSFGQEEKHQARYGEAIQEAYQWARKLAFAGATFQGGMMFLGSLAIVLVLWYGGKLVVDQELSIGSLTSFLLYTVYVAFSLGVLSSLWFDIVKALGATERVHQLVNRVPEISCETNFGYRLTDEEFLGKVEFDDISFAYPSRPDTDVLKRFSLALNPGEVVALVGRSGGGKTTVVNLLQRFYDPNHGEIRLDGKPLTELDIVWTRQNIGVVSQEPVLFGTSIRENISYGKDFATDEEIEKAAREANALQFIKTFPEGYEAKVGERGVRLSGGQKQRIAIARAILKNPKVLCLDEATSALDAESEHLVQQALDRLMKGRTVLVIAHRLSTVKNADRVVVVEGGNIMEMGTHDALLKKGGLYKQLVERQLMQKDEDRNEFQNFINHS